MMGKYYCLRETGQIIKILNDTHDEMLAILKRRNSKAELLIEDEELCQLHDLLLLLRLGHIHLHWADDEEGRFLMFKIDI